MGGASRSMDLGGFFYQVTLVLKGKLDLAGVGSQSHCNKLPQTGLEQQTCTVSQLWRLEVWNQCQQSHCPSKGCRGVSFLASSTLSSVSGNIIPISASIFMWHSLSVSSHYLPSICVWLCSKSSLHKDAMHIGLEPTLMTSFELDHLCRDPISK